MFSDKDIEKAMSDWQRTSELEGIFIDNFNKNNLTPVGYDLRVGDEGFSWNKKSVIEIGKDGKIQIDAHDTVFIRTLESVKLSKKVSGTVHSIVSKIVIKGLSDISTTIDPGWSGRLLISVHNHRDSYTELFFKEDFCTVCFYEVGLASEINRSAQADRQELWYQLLDIASREKDRIDREEKERNKYRNQLLIYSVILAFIIGIGLSWYNSNLGASIAAFLAVVAPIIYDQFLKPISRS